MYSQPWAPSPSTTASAPLFRTANRIPARPTTWSRPAVAPKRQTFPAAVEADGSATTSGSGRTTTVPPDRPLAR